MGGRNYTAKLMYYTFHRNIKSHQKGQDRAGEGVGRGIDTFFIFYLYLLLR